MNYKTEMTENNSTIQELLSTLQNLPNLADAQHGAYVWKKLTAEGGDFVDFVVNDTETAYPDGGMQEGYWYEKFNPATLIASNVRKDVDIWGIVGTLVEGKTGIDYGTVTLNGSQNKVTVSHNLGKSPSFIAIIPDGFSSVSYSDVNNSYGIIGSQALMVDIGYTTSDAVFELEGASNTVTSSSITFWAPSGSNFISDTYYWFTVA